MDKEILLESLASGFRARGAWVERWPDDRLKASRPFDLCVVEGGQFHPIKVKIRHLTPPDAVSPDDTVTQLHQDFWPGELEALRAIEEAGAKAFVALGFFWRPTPFAAWETRVWLVRPAKLEGIADRGRVTVKALEDSLAEEMYLDPSVGWVL